MVGSGGGVRRRGGDGAAGDGRRQQRVWRRADHGGAGVVRDRAQHRASAAAAQRRDTGGVARARRGAGPHRATRIAGSVEGRLDASSRARHVVPGRGRHRDRDDPHRDGGRPHGRDQGIGHGVPDSGGGVDPRRGGPTRTGHHGVAGRERPSACLAPRSSAIRTLLRFHRFHGGSKRFRAPRSKARYGGT